MVKLVFAIQYECSVEEEMGLGIGRLWSYLDGSRAYVDTALGEFGGEARYSVHIGPDLGEGLQGLDMAGEDKQPTVETG